MIDNVKMIDNNALLDNLCKDLSTYDIVSIDTEFERRTSYYAKLSLIQVATKDHCYIIDALTIPNLEIFNSILQNNNIKKIFHSAEQDLEIFLHIFKKLPVNIFDTQIAASACQMGSCISYQKICKSLFNIDINKDLQASNWLQRPLKSEMLYYAAKDVEYLIDLYQMLNKMLLIKNAWKHYDNISSHLTKAEHYNKTTEQILHKIRIPNISAKLLDNLKILISLREEYAKNLDIPRKHCASDEDLFKIAKYLPISDADLKNLKLDRAPLIKGQNKQKILDICSGIRQTL